MRHFEADSQLLTGVTSEYHWKCHSRLRFSKRLTCKERKQILSNRQPNLGLRGVSGGSRMGRNSSQIEEKQKEKEKQEPLWERERVIQKKTLLLHSYNTLPLFSLMLWGSQSLKEDTARPDTKGLAHKIDVTRRSNASPSPPSAPALSLPGWQTQRATPTLPCKYCLGEGTQ